MKPFYNMDYLFFIFLKLTTTGCNKYLETGNELRNRIGEPPFSIFIPANEIMNGYPYSCLFLE